MVGREEPSHPARALVRAARQRLDMAWSSADDSAQSAFAPSGTRAAWRSRSGAPVRRMPDRRRRELPERGNRMAIGSSTPRSDENALPTLRVTFAYEGGKRVLIG